ncbi:MAG: DUF3987 domain-containing protein [Bacteroidetes bacterium]|nr:DUF3987 domain-containing protein [Bacteroidota bacterium]
MEKAQEKTLRGEGEENAEFQDKSTNFKLNPKFDLEKFDIEIKAEAENLIKQSSEAEKESKNIFPVDVFPVPIQQIVKTTNENLDFPIDFIGASILYTASVAIGNTFRVEIKRGFQESALLYLAIVARAGTNKTHPLSFAIQPIIDRDKKTYREYEQARQEYDTAMGLSKNERKEQGIYELSKPVWQKYLLSDYTPEALAEVHKFNKRGIGVYCDELAGWFKNFNRYNKGSEMEFWISNFNSKPINIDRKTNEPVFIPTPFISVAGTIQTGILNELAKDSRTQNGFIDRILFVIPDNIIKEYWSETEINPVIIQNWTGIITTLLNLSVQWDDTLNPVPEILHFTPEAKKLLYKWQRENTDQCNNAESEAIAGIFSKLDMYVARLALILQMMRWACDEGNKEAINTEAVKGAIQLIEYFRLSAVKVYSIISNVCPLDKLSTDKRKLYETLPDAFTTEIALQVAEKLEISERTVKYFLNERELFENIKHGNYQKKI